MSILIIFLVSILLSVVINWILIKFSLNLGVRNLSKEEEIRWQSRKPSVGGLSFYIVFLIMYSILSNFVFNQGRIIETQFRSIDLALIIATTIGFVVGLIDDARNTNPLLKFIGQLLCGLTLVYFGVVIPISPNDFWNGFMTVLWTIFLMNSINMLDNMDGLTTSVSFSILVAIFTFSDVNSHSISYYSVLIIAGLLIGFLFFNWNPSKIYMGDSGSQFLGVVLAHLSIVYLWGERFDNGGYFQINQFFLPLLIFTIPIFDTATVSIHRLLRGQSPFVGGRDHLSHHLVYLGMKDARAVFLLAILNFTFIFIALYIYIYFPQYIILCLLFWILSFCIIQYQYIRAKKLKPIEIEE